MPVSTTATVSPVPWSGRPDGSFVCQTCGARISDTSTSTLACIAASG